MPPQKNCKVADVIEISDPVSPEDPASPLSVMSDVDEEPSSSTMIGNQSLLSWDSIDRELDKAALEQTPEHTHARTVEVLAASKGKKGAYMH